MTTRTRNRDLRIIRRCLRLTKCLRDACRLSPEHTAARLEVEKATLIWDDLAPQLLDAVMEGTH